MPYSEVSFLYVASASILSALFGGLVGALANGWVNRRTTRKTEETERKSLLTLSHIEIYQNEALLDIAERTDDATLIERLTKDFWESSKFRLAQLLPDDDLEIIAAYYVTVDADRLFPIPRTGSLSESDQSHLEDVRQAGNAMLKMVDKYM